MEVAVVMQDIGRALAIFTSLLKAESRHDAVAWAKMVSAMRRRFAADRNDGLVSVWERHYAPIVAHSIVDGSRWSASANRVGPASSTVVLKSKGVLVVGCGLRHFIIAVALGTAISVLLRR